MHIKKLHDKKNIDPSVLLKVYINDAIKVLYLDRKELFYIEKRNYNKFNESLNFFKNKFRMLADSETRIAVIFGNGFRYQKFDDNAYNLLSDFLDFILLLPPETSLFKKNLSKEINGVTVPTLSAILKSLLTFKLPDYWKINSENYLNISLAIIEVFRETSENYELINSVNDIYEKIDDKNSESINIYKEKILKWIKYGFLM